MSLKAYWQRRRSETASVVRKGGVKFTMAQGRLQVVCPESDMFTTRARELNGRWMDKSNVWSFPSRSRRLVELLVVECFGLDCIQK